ncbi:hypothetical protein DFH09DRAFT_82528 [Mycena vulgaris]|nr:hypothetical protein DFH09DRAFT_82528 [Mycena vulgaris]
MPAANYTIDDVSPMIAYSGAWSAGDKATDPLATRYSNGGTFTLCTTTGSSAKFSFSGTQVWIFGAKRGNHGLYSVDMDGKTTQYDGFSANDTFTSLFDSGSLKQGQHTVVITNTMNDTKRPYLDIDYITWSTDLATDSKNITLEDSTSQFSYQPSNTWKTDLPSEMSGFQGSSGHLTQEKDASATLSFSGDNVALFGAVGPALGPYGIKVDGGALVTFNATKQNYAAQIALYRADNLGAGDHTLQVINQPTSTGQGLAIDFALVAGLPASSPSSTSSASASASISPSASASAGKSMSSVELGGLIAAGIAAVCFTATIVGLLYRQINKREMRRQASGGSTDVAAFINPSGAISLNAVSSRNTNPESETAHLLDPQSRV